jgi:hypothetical protein
MEKKQEKRGPLSAIGPGPFDLAILSFFLSPLILGLKRAFQQL